MLPKGPDGCNSCYRLDGVVSCAKCDKDNGWHHNAYGGCDFV